MALLACLGGVALLRSRAPLARSEPGSAPALHRQEGRPKDAPPKRGFLGVVIVEGSVDLGARFEGRVANVQVQVGSRVRRGTVVAALDSKVEQQELAIAEAELLSNRAEEQVAALSFEEAKERLRRREGPGQLSTGAISQEDLSSARYQERMASVRLEKAKALVLEQEARVAQLRQRVAEALVRAPFDGVVAARFVHPGALVQAGQPIVHLLRSGTLQVRFAVPVSQVREMSTGTAVRLDLPELNLALSGQVSQVAPEVDVASLMVFAIADVEEPADRTSIPAGTVVRVNLRMEQARAHDGGK